MKISVQQYATSLFEAVAGKSEKEAKAAVKNFVAILGRNRELSKEAAIIAAFNEIWNRENGEVMATLSSARELGPTARENVVEYLKEKTAAKKIILDENIDKDLIGGARQARASGRGGAWKRSVLHQLRYSHPSDGSFC